MYLFLPYPRKGQREKRFWVSIENQEQVAYLCRGNFNRKYLEIMRNNNSLLGILLSLSPLLPNHQPSRQTNGWFMFVFLLLDTLQRMKQKSNYINFGVTISFPHREPWTRLLIDYKHHINHVRGLQYFWMSIWRLLSDFLYTQQQSMQLQHTQSAWQWK